MSTNGLQAKTSETSAARSDGRLLAILRLLALILVGIGAAGSLSLMLRAGGRTPRFLLVLFVIWILAPFAALLWANLISKCLADLTRVALYSVTLVLAVCSLAIYGGVISPPSGSPHAFVFVAVPPASCLLMIIAIVSAALISRRLSHRPTPAQPSL